MKQTNLLEEEESHSLKKKGRRRRTENYGIVFKNGIADGWVFEVPEAFRETLDILYLRYVDKTKTEERRRTIG